MRFALAVSDLTAAEITQAHIHVAPPGENGPVTFFLSNGGFTNLRLGTLTPSDFLSSPDVPSYDDFVDALLGGFTYMNVHTMTHMDGEIRGQMEE
jgi:hypothetical protein